MLNTANSTFTVPSANVFRRWFNASVWEKAQRDVSHGSVFDFHAIPSVENGECLIQGAVLGSAPKPYLAEAVLSGSPFTNALKLSCTCALGGWCKHTAALLIEASDTTWKYPPLAPPDPQKILALKTAELNRWLEETEQTVAKSQPPKVSTAVDPNGQRQLIVLAMLTPQGNAQRWLALWPGQAKALKTKKGALGKVALARLPYAGSTLSAYDGKGPLFEQLRRWHAGQVEIRDSMDYRRYDQPQSSRDNLPAHAINDNVGVALLKDMALSGELVLLDADRYIERHVGWGPTQTLSWDWVPREPDAMGVPQWSVIPKMQAPHIQLFMGSPMLYLVSLNPGFQERGLDVTLVPKFVRYRWIGKI
jgi:hypothetical protein